MAEDIRREDPDPGLTKKRRTEIVNECKRQWESCLYTSTILYSWLREIRLQKQIFVAGPIIIGGFAGLGALKGFLPDWVIALLALIASLFPALADALKIETNIDEVSRLAAEYKALQDRFRQTAKITAISDVGRAEATLAQLMDRLDVVRSSSVTPPERLFKAAQDKIKAGHYDFEVDGPTFADDRQAKYPP